MSDTSIIAILASVGIILGGTVTADAAALASAIKAGAPDRLVQFVQNNPDSQFAPDALVLAALLSQSKLEDSAVSSENPDLTCRVWVVVEADGTATLNWETTGAASVGFIPMGTLGTQAITASGQAEIAADADRLISVVAGDAAGNLVKCTVNLRVTNGGTSSSLSGLGTGNAVVVSA